MILFINGAFGVGKTTVAELLVKRIPNSLLYDAEEVGYFLQKILKPIDNPDDFQHLPMWRTLTVTTAQLLRLTYGRTLIMPMTIWHEPYFHEVMTGLRQVEPHLFHLCLTATAKTIRKRLRGRLMMPKAYAWCLQRVGPCVTAFQSPAFAIQIATDEKTPDELVAEILSLLHKQDMTEI